jgi:hypothetical protein
VKNQALLFILLARIQADIRCQVTESPRCSGDQVGHAAFDHSPNLKTAFEMIRLFEVGDEIVGAPRRPPDP